MGEHLRLLLCNKYHVLQSHSANIGQVNARLYGKDHVLLQYPVGDAVYRGRLMDSDTDPVTDTVPEKIAVSLFRRYIPGRGCRLL